MYISNQGFFHFFTKYTGVRELYFESSKDGLNWTEDKKLATVKRDSDEKSGHYQVSNHKGNKLVTFFNWHPNGDVDKRTNLFYLQTTDFGNTWTTVEGEKVNIPLTDIGSPAKVIDYHSQEKNVYLKDVNFDEKENPIVLYITSGGHEPGPKSGPREWHVTSWNGKKWINNFITVSDHNYDMGSLFVKENKWIVIAPTQDSPQKYGGGGEIEMWESNDQGKNWLKKQQVTQNSSRNHNYVRRVVNGQNPFYYFWADGNPDKFSQSSLYFGDDDGNVWELPSSMTEESVKPEKIK